MGWLDNSTNNIILDAVLTDYGRQALARNDGSFSIYQFALGDDEINYGIIKKYGRTVGREKIEKNTPVFEAFTNQNLSLKYKLISVDRPLLYLPKLTFSPNATQTAPIELGTSSNNSNIPTRSVVTVQQLPQGNENIDLSLLDTRFLVYVPDLFLYVNSQISLGVDVNKIATYSLAVANTQTAPPILNFEIVAKANPQSIFDVYGVESNNVYKINTSIRVVGESSGISIDIPITVTKN